MTKGLRTIADLDRALRSMQRRARDHGQRLRIIERRLDAEDRHHPVSPATSTNSTPDLPSGGSDLAGTGRGRARAFIRSLLQRFRTT